MRNRLRRRAGDFSFYTAPQARQSPALRSSDVMKTLILLFSLALALGAKAQTNTNLSASAKAENRIELLESLFSSLTAKKEELARLEAQLKEASNDTTKKATSERLQNSATEYLELKSKFEEAAAGVDQSLFVPRSEEAFSWEENLGDIVRPIVTEIKNATAESRKISELRRTEAEYLEQTETARRAIEQINAILTGEAPQGLRAALESQLTVWKQRESIAKNQADAAGLQLREILSTQKSIVESSKAFFRGFISSRGQSLFYGALAFIAVFFGIRSLFFAWQKRMQTKGTLSLNDRIINLAAKVAALFLGLCAVVVVFNLRSDWFLLSIVLIILVGLAWIGLKTLPHFIQAISFVLNVGPVREGEILEFQGVLWLVETIGFKTYLTNDRLEGGRLRVPYKNLLDQLSRSRGEAEALFPTEKGDWILINDSLAEVIAQTPSQVIVRHEGGARVSYPVADFINASPTNLSSGYRHETIFGLDYAHQSLATTAIPESMKAALEKELVSVVPKESIKRVSVHFVRAGASSLDFEIEVDLEGSAAKRYQEVSFAMQRTLVNLCTEKNWEIPFPQLAITRKPAGS